MLTGARLALVRLSPTAPGPVTRHGVMTTYEAHLQLFNGVPLIIKIRMCKVRSLSVFN